jgi:hypothetical protein
MPNLSSYPYCSTTTAANGKATISFYGNAISLNGSTSDYHGLYGVTLDGGIQQTYNGYVNISKAYRPKQLLYLASNLSPGPHQLELVNLEEGKVLDFDCAVITTYGDAKVAASSPSSGSGPSPSPSLGSNSGSSSNSGPIPSPSSTSTPIFQTPAHHTTSTAAIAGGVISTVAVLVLLGILLSLFIRRRRRSNVVDHFDAGMRNHTQVIDSELAPDNIETTMAGYGTTHGGGPQGSLGGSLGAVTFAQPRHAPGLRSKRAEYAQYFQNIAGGGRRSGSNSAPDTSNASTLTAVLRSGHRQGIHPVESVEEEDMPPPNYTRIFGPGESTTPSPILFSVKDTPTRRPPPVTTQTSDTHVRPHLAWAARTPPDKKEHQANP